jgi:hypothetical protein
MHSGNAGGARMYTGASHCEAVSSAGGNAILLPEAPLPGRDNPAAEPEIR